MQNLTKEKIEPTGGFADKFCKIFKEQILPNLNFFTKQKKETILQFFVYKASITKIKKKRQG